ncbi:hypothetical protein LS48_09785 [Aequorivita aquimaris]|uniref:Uncharacterized protein n=1 Tax=Aequorivita aquimaris TaxID=1548749 RepID=A0A137RH71_9FLAO|nr:hypothetical protein LS48_09785 [Aequorivita aquimaris]
MPTINFSSDIFDFDSESVSEDCPKDWKVINAVKVIIKIVLMIFFDLISQNGVLIHFFSVKTFSEIIIPCEIY